MPLLGGLFGKVAPTSDPVAVATVVGQKQEEARRNYCNGAVNLFFHFRIWRR